MLSTFVGLLFLVTAAVSVGMGLIREIFTEAAVSVGKALKFRYIDLRAAGYEMAGGQTVSTCTTSACPPAEAISFAIASIFVIVRPVRKTFAPS